MQVSVSYVSVANAEANLSADNPGWDVQALKAQTQKTWNSLLGRFRVGGGTAAQQADVLHRPVSLVPSTRTLFSDANGQYTGFDNPGASDWPRGQGGEYANFSGWDIYRSEVPLIATADPQVSRRCHAVARGRGGAGRLARPSGRWPTTTPA